MTTLEQMKAELAVKMATRKAEMNLLVETKKIELEMTKLDSPMYETKALLEADTAKLDAIIEHIEDLYSADSRKVSYTYGYGVVVNKIMTIVKSIQFSTIENKLELLMMTGLNEQTIEDMLEAFGNTAYFSVKSLEVMEAIPMDIQATRDQLQQISDDLGLVSKLNLSKINEKNVEYQYTAAQLRADQLLENTIKYADEAEVEYDE